MSLCSMTGHGRGAAAAGGLRVEVEASSVNRKQLDIEVNLPRELGSIEPRVFEVVRERIGRGRVKIAVSVLASRDLRAQSIRVDEELAQSYLSAARKAARRLGVADDLSLSRLLEMPDVLQFERPGSDVEKAWPVVEDALRRALKALARMRAKEGAALAADLRKRLAILDGFAAEIRRLAPAALERQRTGLLARLSEAGLAGARPDERLVRELALFADRSDIAEEVTRLDSHGQQARAMLASREPVGRSLDFLVQETMREINTIGSKANDGAILKIVVAFKSELERIREQAQNIE